MRQTAARLDAECDCEEVYSEYQDLTPALSEIASGLAEAVGVPF